MKRKCIRFPVENIIDTRQFENANIEIYIDSEIISEVIEYLKTEKFKKKTRMILFTILSRNHNDSLYGREDISSKAENITAMKYSGSENNLRIYCKEFHRGNKKIVMITCFAKKTQKASDKRIKTLLKKIGGYEYDF